MHLALEMGWTLRELEQRMEEREFLLWTRFAKQVLMPRRSIELHLANIAMWVAHSAGATGMALGDFMFPARPRPPDTATTTAGAISGIAGRKVIKLGQGRKHG